MLCYCHDVVFLSGCCLTVIMLLKTSSETVSCLIRLTESGVEVEEWEEALESLRELADCYTEEDF